MASNHLHGLVAVIAFALLLPLLSCDQTGFVDPPGGPDTPVAIRLDSVFDAITEGDSTLLHASVLGSDSTLLSGVPVTWTSSDQGIATVKSTSDTDALLSARAPGSTTIAAHYQQLRASATIQVHRRPTDLVYVSGSGQTGEFGAQLPDSLVVRAVDRRGDPVAGVDISFVVTDGGGSVAPNGGLTDADGLLSTAWTLGPSGAQQAEARATQAQQRVHQLKDSVVVFTATAGASSQGTLTLSTPDTLFGVGDTTTLTAQARAADGSVVSNPNIQWSSLAPQIATVDTMGTVTARAIGTAVIAAATTCCSADSTSVVVEPADPGTVSDLAVSSTLTDGVTLTWTQVDDGAGQPADYVIRHGSPTVDWGQADSTQIAVDGTAIQQTMTYTVTGLAQATPYQFQVAAYRGTLGVDAVFSALSNVASASTDSGSAGTGTLADECQNPSAAWIWCDDFDQDRLSSYFEYSSAGGAFTRAADVGVDSSSAMLVHYAAGQVNVGYLHLAFGRTPSSYMRPVDAGTADYRNIYWRVFVRNAPNWTGGGGDKLSRAIVFATSGWAEAMAAYLWSGGTNGNYLVADPASGTDEAGNLQTTTYNDTMRWLGVLRGSTPLFDADHVGQWYCVEAHVRLNDAGQSDGVYEFWVNGHLEAHAADLNWLGAYDQYGINAVFLENYWNGNGSPQSQNRYLDNFVVSTARIGCGGTS